MLSPLLAGPHSALKHNLSIGSDLQVSNATSITVPEADLYGRWGIWHLTVAALVSSAEFTIDLHTEGGSCPGSPPCGTQGTCLRAGGGDWFCRCSPGWYGHMCEVRARCSSPLLDRTPADL